MKRGADRWADILLAVLVFLVVGVFFVPLEWRIFDPSMIYAYIRSPLIDRDLDFANEAEPQDWWAIHGQRTETGKFANVWAVGPALFWTPAALLAHGTTLLLQRAGFSMPADGYSLPYMVLVGLTTPLVVLLGLLATYRLARNVAPPVPALLTTIALWLATPLLFYSARFPIMAHGISFATVALFLGYWLYLRQKGQVLLWHWLTLGALGGLMVLQRWQDALVLLIPPCVDLLERRLNWRRLSGYLGMGLSTAVVFSPQLVMWQILYGRPLLVPQGPDFFHWTEPALAATLFSTNRGLFLWCPLFLLGLAGLVWLWWHDRPLAVPITLVCLLTWYLNSAAWDWWGGGGFGPRRFIGLLPLLAPGLAGLLGRLARARWAQLLVLLVVVVLCWQQWAWMDMVFYVDFSDGGNPLPAEAYALRYGEQGPAPASDYRDYLESGQQFSPEFYLTMYDTGLPLPESVLLEPLRRTLVDPTILLRPRPSRWSTQLPPFFALAQRLREGGVGRLIVSWPAAALVFTAVGLAVLLFLWRSFWPAGKEPGGGPVLAWAEKALPVALFLVAGAADGLILLLA